MASEKKKIALVVAADEPALFFSSIRAAESYLEAVDVLDGVYPVAYSPTGDRFTLNAQDDHVVIEPDLCTPKDPAGLRSLLKHVLASRGLPQSEEASLENLIAVCEPYVDVW
jgi:hypothetical protein